MRRRYLGKKKVIAVNTVGLWHFDDDGYNGSGRESVTGQQQGPLSDYLKVAGKFGTAMKTTAESVGKQLCYNVPCDLHESEFTIEFWIKTQRNYVSSPLSIFIGAKDESDAYPQMKIMPFTFSGNDGHTKIYFGNEEHTGLLGSINLGQILPTDEGWHHLAIQRTTFMGSLLDKIDVYVDGSFATGANSSTLPKGGDMVKLILAADPIDELRISNINRYLTDGDAPTEPFEID